MRCGRFNLSDHYALEQLVDAYLEASDVENPNFDVESLVNVILGDLISWDW